MKSNMEDIAWILAELHRNTEQMLALINNLQDSLIGSKEGKLEDLFDNDAYKRFHAFKEEGYRGTPPSNDEWVEFERLFRIAFPDFYQLVAIDHRLTSDQLHLCMLMRLSFPHYIIARVLSVESGRVSRLKAQANKKLFDDRHARTLEYNLKLHFKQKMPPKSVENK